MKNRNLSKKISSFVARTALLATTVNVNSTYEFWWHQPKLPKNAKKLRKF